MFHVQLFFHKLFDFKRSVSHSICLKFSEETPGAISLPQFALLVVIFSLMVRLPTNLNFFKTKLFFLWTPINKFGVKDGTRSRS